MGAPIAADMKFLPPFRKRETRSAREIVTRTGPTHRRPIRLYAGRRRPRTAPNFVPIFCAKNPLIFKVPIFVHQFELCASG
jgi:hypothetical protein